MEEAIFHHNLGANSWVHREEGGGGSVGPFSGVGLWGGIKRWGIEGIRIGTSDRFGRGRGEFCFHLVNLVHSYLYTHKSTFTM